jgi:hypothetical protein
MAAHPASVSVRKAEKGTEGINTHPGAQQGYRYIHSVPFFGSNLSSFLLKRMINCVAGVPETSEHTSVKQRVDHITAQDKTAELEASKGKAAACRVPVRRAVWKMGSGSARSRIGAGSNARHHA